MQILDRNDIDFSRLKKLDCKDATESTLYCDDNVLYKEYNNFLVAQPKRKKLMLLSNGSPVSNAVIPNILLMDGFFLLACGMEYIHDAVSFRKYRNSDEFIRLLYLMSSSLKKIHQDPRNIVIGDLHFDNIIIDKNMNYYFIDMDSCMVDGIPADRLPKALKYYVINRGNFKFEVGRETDKLCMFLATLGAIFGKNIDSLDMYDYDEKAEQIYTLKNMREFVLQIKNNSNGIPEVPYLNELISISDIPGFKKIRVMNVRKN